MGLFYCICPKRVIFPMGEIDERDAGVGFLYTTVDPDFLFVVTANLSCIPNTTGPFPDSTSRGCNNNGAEEFGFMGGLAPRQVPEPRSLLLLGLGLASAGFTDAPPAPQLSQPLAPGRNRRPRLFWCLHWHALSLPVNPLHKHFSPQVGVAIYKDTRSEAFIHHVGIGRRWC